VHRKRHNYIQKHKHHVTDIVYMRERELKEGGRREAGGWVGNGAEREDTRSDGV
jgi:hypothetical protein